MPSNIFSEFQRQQAQPAQNFDAIYSQYMQAPMKALSGQFNIPVNLQNNPQGIAEHLLRSGQITQQELNAARQQYAQMFGGRRM